jgi:hypothetical protein
MTIRADGRRLIQVTMKPDFYDQIKAHCDELDLPVSAWARLVFERAMRERWRPQ